MVSVALTLVWHQGRQPLQFGVEVPMLPAVIDRFKPALALVQSIVTTRQRSLDDSQDQPVSPPVLAATTATGPAGASEEDYFSGQPSVTQVMTHVFERVIGYLNEHLDAVSTPEGRDWRDDALQQGDDGTPKHLTHIPEPGDAGFSFRKAAQIIQVNFNMDYLAHDDMLSELMDETAGFSLHGMTVADLVEAFADPDSAANEKVEEIFSKGLAGHEGSEAKEQLDQAESQLNGSALGIAQAYLEVMAPDAQEPGRSFSI
jgi:hypothetical protein